MSLDIDMTPLWDSINQFFPMFFAIFAFIGGISIAIRLGDFLIDKIRSSFK